MAGAVHGCAGGTSGQDAGAAASAIVALQRAFAQGDLEGVCAHMSRAARRQAGLFAHGTPGQCAQDLAEAFQLTQPGPIRGTRPPPRVERAAAADGRATVTARPAFGGPLELPLVNDGERWRLESFLGSSERAARRAAAAIARAAFPPAPASQRVRVADGPDFACFPLVADRFPAIEGGCQLTASGRNVRLTIDTPFGRYDFGECSLGYAVATDAGGRTWTSRVAFGSPGAAGCADVDACADSTGQPLPWRGRLRATRDGLRHDMDACLDTCVGYFTGRITMRWLRERGWTIESAGASVGRSGLALRGRLRARPAAIRIEAAGA